MQAAGAHAHAKHAQSEPETGEQRISNWWLGNIPNTFSMSLYIEHQVIQIQTQQAPIPSQAEVVLSDGKSKAVPYIIIHIVLCLRPICLLHTHTHICIQVMSSYTHHTYKTVLCYQKLFKCLYLLFLLVCFLFVWFDFSFIFRIYLFF